MLYEDLQDVVLVGFSYGGLVITGALEHISDRVSHLVYLDAFVPADGESLETISGSAGRAAAIGPGASWLVPPLPREFDDPAEGSWSAARRTPIPPGASASRSGSLARWRTTPLPGPTSRRPPSPAPSRPGRSGPPRTGPGARQPGATGKSPLPT